MISVSACAVAGVSEFPWVYQSEHPVGFAIGYHRDSWSRVIDGDAVAPQCFAREELEDARRAHDFAFAFREGLAFLAGQQAAEIVGARHES